MKRTLPQDLPQISPYHLNHHLRWAIYLRTSTKEVQNPLNSQARQRDIILQNLVRPLGGLIIREYIDIDRGGNYDRLSYQQMILDAREGHFNIVACENTDRFSRDDGFGLLTIDQLAASGVLVRFAQYPHVDPLDPMGRMYVGMRLSNGRGETLMLAYRVRGGMESAMRAGRFVGRAPDGYLNRQETPPDNERHMYGKLKRWIVKDETRWPIVRRC